MVLLAITGYLTSALDEASQRKFDADNFGFDRKRNDAGLDLGTLDGGGLWCFVRGCD